MGDAARVGHGLRGAIFHSAGAKDDSRPADKAERYPMDPLGDRLHGSG